MQKKIQEQAATFLQLNKKIQTQMKAHLLLLN